MVNLNQKLHEKLAEATWKLWNHLISCLKTEGNRKKKKTCNLCTALLCCSRPLQTKIKQNFASRLGSYHVVPRTTLRFGYENQSVSAV